MVANRFASINQPFTVSTVGAMATTSTEVTCSPATLRRLRVVSGLSIAELATAAKLSRACVARIESGDRVARSASTRKLAAALGVHSYDLHPESRANVENIAAMLTVRRAGAAA